MEVEDAELQQLEKELAEEKYLESQNFQINKFITEESFADEIKRLQRMITNDPKNE